MFSLRSRKFETANYRSDCGKENYGVQIHNAYVRVKEEPMEFSSFGDSANQAINYDDDLLSNLSLGTESYGERRNTVNRNEFLFGFNDGLSLDKNGNYDREINSRSEKRINKGCVLAPARSVQEYCCGII